jgi:hypothetical protein
LLTVASNGSSETEQFAVNARQAETLWQQESERIAQGTGEWAMN